MIKLIAAKSSKLFSATANISNMAEKPTAPAKLNKP